MKLGLLAGGLRSAAALGRFAARAETAGFDSLWMGDHVSFPAPVLDALQVLACYAAHTERITLGTCVYLLPLRHPTPVAKMVASLDFLCGGRLVFGVGVGGEFPREFEACGVPVAERGGRTDEAIEILRRLWSGAKEPFAGRFFDVPAVALAPAPARPGGPPIWVGGRSEAALRRAARYGDGYVGHFLGPDGFRARMERIHALAAEAGRNSHGLAGALLTFAFVDPDRGKALDRAAGMLGAMCGRDMRTAAERYAIVGPPEECRERIERLREAGVGHLILSPMAHREEEVALQVERLRELRPRP